MTALRSSSLWILLTCMIFLNAAAWLSVRDVKAKWANVPPVPSERGMTASALGDKQFAYREISVMIQNIGNAGGNSISFRQYDYEKLRDWFFLGYQLDPRSNFMPTMAAYYFGAVDDPSKIPPLLEYLRMIGAQPGTRQWRWLAQAVFLARYSMKDLDKAYELSIELAASKDPTLPMWAKQMPAFVLTARGDKDEAYGVMMAILQDSAEKLPPQEVNTMRDYICTRILDPEKAKVHPLCQNIP